MRHLDDRGVALPVAVQFRWCVHELCPRCAAGVVEACPVCAASGPQGLEVPELEREALEAVVVDPMPDRLPLWPWFTVAGAIAAALMFCPQWSRLIGASLCR